MAITAVFAAPISSIRCSSSPVLCSRPTLFAIFSGLAKGLSTVVIPVNRPVYVSEQSPDVIHSFWVPEFRIKQDVVPGLTTHEEFTPVRTGTYRVICTEFCGSGHSGMVTTLRVASQAAFVIWLRKNGGQP